MRTQRKSYRWGYVCIFGWLLRSKCFQKYFQLCKITRKGLGKVYGKTNTWWNALCTNVRSLFNIRRRNYYMNQRELFECALKRKIKMSTWKQQTHQQTFSHFYPQTRHNLTWSFEKTQRHGISNKVSFVTQKSCVVSFLV